VEEGPFESEADEARIDRWGRLRKMDRAAQLQRMMGKAAKFRGVQKEAIDAIVAGKSHVVAVMPTGAGKSMLFMLPAWAEQGGTTVVVMPLIAMQEVGNIVRRVGQSSPARRSRSRVGDARISSQGRVRDVFEPVASNTAVGSNRD
jgi:superfamily II DNA helicase RecQ